MAFSHGSQAAIFGNGYALCPWTKSVSSGRQTAMENTTVLCNTSGAQSYVAGLEDGTLSIEGLWDGDESVTPSIDKILQGAFVAGAILTYCPQGDVLGYPAFALMAERASYDIQTPGNTLSKFSASAQSKVGLERGTILLPATTLALGSGATTPVDNSVPTTNGAVAYLQCIEHDGGDPQYVTIQHSSDDTTYVDLITFAPDTIDALRTVVAGTIRRYIRIGWLVSATTTVQLMLKRY